MRPLLVLTPILPCRAGNGLAMRAAQFVDAASDLFDVMTVVVPVAGHPPAPGSAPPRPTATLDLVESRRPGTELSRLLADRAWRDRLSRAQPLPRAARLAPPTLAADVVRAARALGEVDRVPVHVLRSYLAPLGVAVAELLGSPWATLDLDDDDEALARSRGDASEAEACNRLVDTFAPLYSGVAIASSIDAAALGRRHQLHPVAITNSVPLPKKIARSPSQPPDLLLVGNLTYPPNGEAAEVLVREILPRLRQKTGLALSVTLAGDFDTDSEVTALGRSLGVHLLGFVDDLDPLYARAAATVVPLASGSGIKIKLLEAFAHRIPVVTTPVGASGLSVIDGVHLRIAEEVNALVDATASVLSDPSLADRRTRTAERYLLEHHSASVVFPAVRAFLTAAADRI